MPTCCPSPLAPMRAVGEARPELTLPRGADNRGVVALTLDDASANAAMPWRPAWQPLSVVGRPRSMKRSVLLAVAICFAITAVIAATYIIPRSDPTYQKAVQTVQNAGPTRLTLRLPQ